MDDSRGVGEPLDETQSIAPGPELIRLGPGLGATGKHYLLIGAGKSAANLYRPLQARIFAEPLLFISPMNASTTAVSDWVKTYATTKTFSNTSLPLNVELMTLQVWDNSTVLLRLSHQFGLNEDTSLSQPVTIDLNSLFVGFTIQNVTELTLTANQPVSNLEKRKGPKLFSVEDLSESSHPYLPPRYHNSAPLITLNPMDIKTFQVVLA